MAALSEEAGRILTTDEVAQMLRELRKQTGQSEPQFTDPQVMEAFLEIVRSWPSQ